MRAVFILLLHVVIRVSCYALAFELAGLVMFCLRFQAPGELFPVFPLSHGAVHDHPPLSQPSPAAELSVSRCCAQQCYNWEIRQLSKGAELSTSGVSAERAETQCFDCSAKTCGFNRSLVIKRV